MKVLGFQASKADPSLFFRNTSSSKVFLRVYVDDIVFKGSSSDEINQVIKQLHHKFSLKDIGALHFFLGIEVHRNHTGDLFLSQKKNVYDLLTSTEMAGASSTPTPMVGTPKLTVAGGSPLVDVHEYRSIIVKLQYVCITRLDIAFCVNKLS